MKPAVVLTLAIVMAGMFASTATASDPLRLAIKSGSPQDGHAMAPPATNDYETAFDRPLVVTVSPPNGKVRFRCITPGCSLPPLITSAKRHDAVSFDVDADKGVASIKLILRSASVQPLVVVAEPASGHGNTVRFFLTAR